MSRKSEIIDALIMKIKEQGITRDFTLSELADSVNIGKSTLYEYFSSKDEILKEAITEFINQSIASLSLEVIGENASFEELFKSQMTSIFAVAKESRMIMETMTKDIAECVPVSIREDMKAKMQETRDVLLKRFHDFFKIGIEEGVISANLTEATVFIIRSLTVGSIMSYSQFPGTLSIDVVVDELYRAVLALTN